jgi:hypothetical protein
LKSFVVDDYEALSLLPRQITEGNVGSFFVLHGSMNIKVGT